MLRNTDLFGSARRLAVSAMLAAGAMASLCPAALALPNEPQAADRSRIRHPGRIEDKYARRAEERLNEARRKEGEALLSLTDAAMMGRPVASDFAIDWRNDFLKAEPGTFVPFTV